jgi:CubicO group peptidase (beta-lactamase class C family)
MSAPAGHWRDVCALMDSAVGAVAPALSLVVVRGDGVEIEYACGALTPGGLAAEPNAWFDLASLTKPIAVATPLASLLDRGAVQLDAPLEAEWQVGAPGAAGPLTLRGLLGHTSGFPAWLPLYESLPQPPPQAAEVARRAAVVRTALDGIARNAPAPTYSDLGYVLLGCWLEGYFRAPLAEVFRREVCHPHGLSELGFGPVAGVPVLPTEDCGWRGRVLHGEVHDENCAALGGVTGHAGLFGTARGVARWAAHWLSAYRGGGWIGTSTVEQFWGKSLQHSGTWRLGWDSPSIGASSAGSRVSRCAVGHLGFTGCSVWIDPERSSVVVLLTNRVHPHRSNEAIRVFRPRLHDAVWNALDASA